MSEVCITVSEYRRRNGEIVKEHERCYDIKNLDQNAQKRFSTLTEKLTGLTTAQGKAKGDAKLEEIASRIETTLANLDRIKPRAEAEGQLAKKFPKEIVDNPNNIINSVLQTYDIKVDKQLEYGEIKDNDFADYKQTLEDKYGSFEDEENLKDYLSDAIAYEGAIALDKLHGFINAIGWYDEKVKGAMHLMEKVHPELKDRVKGGWFKLGLAVTSNGVEVEDNFKYANEVWEGYKETGRFPEKGFGQQGAGMEKGFALINSMLDSGVTEDEMIDFFVTPFIAGDLALTKKEAEHIYGGDKEAFKLASQELVSEPTFGAAALGPKIGGAFFLNMMDNYDQLTMDRWFIRTMSRLKGNLVLVDDDKVAGARKRLVNAISNLTDKDLASIRKHRPDALEVLDDPKEFVRRMNRVFIKANIRKSHFEASSGDTINEMRLAVNRLIALEGEMSIAPKTGRERRFFRDVMKEAQKRLKENTGIDITIADFQASLWYPEKVMWDSIKGQDYDDVREGYFSVGGAPDYMNGAQTVLSKVYNKSDEEIKQYKDEYYRGRANSGGNESIGSEVSGSNKETQEQITDHVRARFFEEQSGNKAPVSFNEITKGSPYEGKSLKAILSTEAGKKWWDANGKAYRDYLSKIK